MSRTCSLLIQINSSLLPVFVQRIDDAIYVSDLVQPFVDIVRRFTVHQCALDIMCKRYLSLACSRLNILASSVFGCGAASILRTLQMCLKPEVSLSDSIPRFLTTVGAQKHEIELRALARLQEVKQKQLIEHDIVLLTWNPNVRYNLLTRYCECWLQLLVTPKVLYVEETPSSPDEAMSDSFAFLKPPPIPPALANIEALFDNFSFNAESHGIAFFISEKDRLRLGSFYITLCVTRDWNYHDTSNPNSDRFNILSPSILISDIAVRRTFDVLQWSTNSNPMPSIARVMPSWLQLKEEGNTAFKAGRFREAIQSYSSALRCDDDVVVTVLLHLCLCMLELRKTDKVLQLAVAAFAINRSCPLASLLITNVLIEQGDDACKIAAREFRSNAIRLSAGRDSMPPFASSYPCVTSLHRRLIEPVLETNEDSSQSIEPAIIIALRSTLPVSSDLSGDRKAEPAILNSINALETLELGVSLSESGRFQEAEIQFSKSWESLKLRSTALMNRAQSYSKGTSSKLNNRAEAESWLLDATAATAIDSTPKARLRQAQAWMARHCPKEALLCCQLGLSADKIDLTVLAELDELKQRAMSVKGLPQQSLPSSSSPASSSSFTFSQKEQEAFTSSARMATVRKILQELAVQHNLDSAKKIVQLFDVPDFASEMEKQLSGSIWPSGLKLEDVRIPLLHAVEKARWYKTDKIRFQQTSTEAFFKKVLGGSELVHRLGCTHAERMRWFINEPFGSVQFVRETLNQTLKSPVHSFMNQQNIPQNVDRGTTHVAIGPQHIDLSCLASLVVNPSSTTQLPLNFVGFGPNAVCVAKSLLISQMLKSDDARTVVDSVMEVWFSASMHASSRKAMYAALTTLLRTGKMDADVRAVLEHWQAVNVPLQEARSEWIKGSHNLAKTANFKLEKDRIAFCVYALGGDILPPDQSSLGNITMFGYPAPCGERDMDETVFDMIDLRELLKQRCKLPQGTIMDAVRNHLRQQITKLYQMVQSREVTLEFRVGCMRTQRSATIAAIKKLQPWTMYWSNMPDYLPPRQFHEIAQQCSRDEDTVHDAASVSWTRDVKGTSLLDFGDQEMRQEILRIIDSVHIRSRNNQIVWGSEFDKLVQLPPFDCINNTANFVLSPLHQGKWHSAFFSTERTGVPMQTTQRPLSAIKATTMKLA